MNAEQEKIWSLLSRSSKLCLRRKRWRWGKEYRYRPRAHLLRRLAQELQTTEGQALAKLENLREFLLTYPQYFRL